MQKQAEGRLSRSWMPCGQRGRRVVSERGPAGLINIAPGICRRFRNIFSIPTDHHVREPRAPDWRARAQMWTGKRSAPRRDDVNNSRNPQTYRRLGFCDRRVAANGTSGQACVRCAVKGSGVAGVESAVLVMHNKI